MMKAISPVQARFGNTSHIRTVGANINDALLLASEGFGSKKLDAGNPSNLLQRLDRQAVAIGMLAEAVRTLALRGRVPQEALNEPLTTGFHVPGVNTNLHSRALYVNA